MKRLIILGAILSLAVARPETYKEKEDFQFSRSSSDDGTKAGYYGAQRGNMGGNYERAHNMDALAQNQMSGLVRQVEGELGDGAKTRTGNVYTAATSKGTYGSGNFDLSNLAGRNFQEGTSHDDSQSRSSLDSSSAYNVAGYTNSRTQNARRGGYQAAGQSGLNLQSDTLQSLDNSQGTSVYDYGRHSSHSTGYNAQSGFQQHREFDSSNTDAHSGGYGSNINTRLISATPVRIVVRPGTRVAIPVAAQLYDTTHGSSLIDQNALNSDAEVLSNGHQRTVYTIPTKAKHYESAYNYRKEWEKHDTIPSTFIVPTTPTENPFPKNSELYEDSQVRTASKASDQYDTPRVDSQRAAHSSNIYGGYSANVQSASSQSSSNYDTQHRASSQSNSNTYKLAGYNAGSNHQGSSSDSSLNGYNQAQYNAGSRYHGVAANTNGLTETGFNSGINSDLNSQVEDLNAKPKSYHSSYSYYKSWEHQGDPYVIKPASSGYYDGQSSQRLTTGSTTNQGYAATGSHYQHSHQSGVDCDENSHIRMARSYNIDQYQDMQKQNIEDLGQQVQDFGQQEEDLGQQNVEDLGQQVQDFGQQVEDVEQKNVGDFGQQLQDFGQQVEDLGQTQNLEDAVQQSQKTWDNLENLSQQSHNKWDEIHKTWDKFEDLGQNNHWDVQETQNTNNESENLGQKTQNELKQPAQNTENKQGNYRQDDDQQVQDFSNISQHGKENVDEQSEDHHYEQSNKFNQDEIQQESNISKYLQSSRTQNDNKYDQVSTWKFDQSQTQIGSHQSGSLHKSENEYANSNGNQFNWNAYLQSGGMDQQSYKTDNLHIMPQLESSYLNNDPLVKPFWEQLSGNKQESTHYHSSTQFQETHKFQEYSNLNMSSSIHRQEQTTNAVSYPLANTVETRPTRREPISSLWSKLDNIDHISTSIEDNKNVSGENDLRHEYMNSQNSYQNSKQTNNTESISEQQHYNQQHVNNEDIVQNQSKVIDIEKETPQDVGRGDISPEDDTGSVLNKKPRYPFELPISEEAMKKNNLSLNKGRSQDQINHIENQGQDNVQDIDQQDFGQHGVEQSKLENFEQHQKQEQPDLQDFGALNIGQQNLHVFAQNENQEQQKHDNQYFGHQGNLQNYKKIEQQNLREFDQHENLEQQSVHDFVQHDHPNQQNIHDFAQHENLEQHWEVLGHNKNLEHQNIQDFGQHENREKETIRNYGQQENLEQQNLQDFGIKEILEQQNLHDFGQQENLEQQNLHDFGQQQNLDQQNLQDFGQKENLEQQNLHDFGQQENSDQQNLQDFGQKENLEQRNLHDFGQKQQEFRQQDMQDFGQQSDNLNVHMLSQKSEQNFKYLDNQEQQVTNDKINEHSQTYLPNPEEPILVKHNNDLQSSPNTAEVLPIEPIEPVTEIPGFWKSVGNKFSKAKSSIASWFHS